MLLSPQSSDDQRIYNNGSPGCFANRTLKLFSPKSKLESVLKPNIVKITDKSILLDKIKNSQGKPGLCYAHKVQKLQYFGRKKANSPRSAEKSRNAKEAKDILDEDFPTLTIDDDDDADLTPRNRVEHLTSQNSYETATQNDDDFDIDLESSGDLCMWHSVQGEVTLSMDLKLNNEQSCDQSLDEYLYLDNETTVDATSKWKDLNGLKEKQDNGSSQDTELIRYDTKTFRSQETSTNDLFQFRKLSVFAATILKKCHELEEMQFNSSGSSSEDIFCMGKNLTQPRLRTIPEETVQEDAMQMSQDCSDKNLCVFKDKGKSETKDLLHHHDLNPNSMWTWIISPIIGILVFIVGIIYIRFQVRPIEQPLWRQYLDIIINFIYFYK
ncbi:uncharacterized protein LOC110178840 [Drosophila serrata]|uniref:uncharacterized protein LOC110178840 n=1 Tax=Drosophila serrata TaxID=7274 RepID=UPI000A1D10B0|nr:uncharacterized protein LOC110178840 [Drosophila serrata]